MKELFVSLGVLFSFISKDGKVAKNKREISSSEVIVKVTNYEGRPLALAVGDELEELGKDVDEKAKAKADEFCALLGGRSDYVVPSQYFERNSDDKLSLADFVKGEVSPVRAQKGVFFEEIECKLETFCSPSVFGADLKANADKIKGCKK